MTERLNWDDAPAFLAVARTGTLTFAAKSLGTGIATVSRRIARLESRLGVPLFVRHQSGYRLTDQGATLLPRAEALEQAMGAFRAQAATETEAIGHVRLATAENLANSIIIPGLAPLLARHPGLSIEILTDVSTINLHGRDADLALRMVRPERGNVSVRRVGTLGFGLYGSPEYMAARDTGPDAGRFDGDRFIGWSERQGGLPAAQWIERTLRGQMPVVTTTTLSAQLSSATAGLGLAILPHFLAREAGLREVPLELELDQPIWLALHSDLSASLRIRVVADHLAEIVERNHERLAGVRQAT